MLRRVISMCAAAVVAAVGLGCGLGQPRPGTVQDEAMRAGVTPEQLVRPTDDYFHDMDYNLVDGKRPAFTQQEIEGRNMWMVWTGGDDRLWDRLTIDSLGTLRSAQDHLVASRAARLDLRRQLRTPQPLDVSRAGQRTVLHGGDRSGSEPLRPVARRARPDLPARSVRRRGRSIPASRSARAARPCPSAPTTASRPASSASGCFRTPTSTRRRAEHWNSERFYNDPTYYFDRKLVRPYRVGMSCGVLSRRAEPDQAAGRSREPEVGEPELERRRAVFLVGPRLQLARRRATQTASSIRRCTSRGRARSTPRSSRPTTSTTRGR